MKYRMISLMWELNKVMKQKMSKVTEKDLVFRKKGEGWMVVGRALNNGEENGTLVERRCRNALCMKPYHSV